MSIIDKVTKTSVWINPENKSKYAWKNGITKGTAISPKPFNIDWKAKYVIVLKQKPAKALPNKRNDNEMSGEKTVSKPTAGIGETNCFKYLALLNLIEQA